MIDTVQIPSLDEYEFTRKLYLSSGFTKLWKHVIKDKNLKSYSWICASCNKLFDDENLVFEHYKESTHAQYCKLPGFMMFNILNGDTTKIGPEAKLYAIYSLPTSIPIPLRTGYPNLGNSCYIGSVLVALSHIPKLLKASAISANLSSKLFAATSILHHTFIRYLLSFLNFNPTIQEDACEFLTFLIDSLAKDKTIEELFDGSLKHVSKCSNCREETKLLDSFRIITVPLSANGWNGMPKKPGNCCRFGETELWEKPGKSSFSNSFISVLQHGTSEVYNLETCFSSIFLDSPFECPKCHCKTELRTTINKYPEILILQIERFGKRWFGLGKLYQFVSFPIGEIDLGVFAENVIDAKYELNSVIVHSGFMNKGHYICYAKRNGIWYKFDDADVSVVSEQVVRESQAYILCYSRKHQREMEEEMSNWRWDACSRVQLFSDPSEWVGKVIYPEEIEWCNQRAELKMNSPNPDALRNFIIGRYNICDERIEISEESADALWKFLYGGNTVPNIELKEGGVSVSGIIKCLL